MLGEKKHPFRFKNRLLSLDSTTISLCLSLFPWADFRQAKGGVKLHVLLSHDDYLPEFAVLTEARSMTSGRPGWRRCGRARSSSSIAATPTSPSSAGGAARASFG